MWINILEIVWWNGKLAYIWELSATPDERQCYYWTDGQNLNSPPHIAAHLQAAQSRHTSQSLQKSRNFPTHGSNSQTVEN
ncbi:MAG: hypothetical protein JSS64_08935 [Bacteroidetes bacterium]|nr:hypothetical protein [Bacteroidota bacterium]